MNSKNFTIYRASAGSGKTFTLTLNYIAQLLKNPQFAHRKILAMTFTIATANEMKERILKELSELSGDFLENLKKETGLSESEIKKNAKIAFWAILNDYGNLNITTIDAFFQKILRNLTQELGINSQFDVEIDTKLPIKEAVKAVIANSAEDEYLQEKIISFLEHKLENENWNIQRDLENFADNIFKETFQKREKKLREQIKNDSQKISNSIKTCKKIKSVFEENMSALAKERYAFFVKCDAANDDSLKGVGVIDTYYKKISSKIYSDGELLSSEGIKSAISGNTKHFQKKNKFLPDYFSVIISDLKETENFRMQNIEKYNSACLFLRHIYPLQLLENISMEIDRQSKEQNRFMLAKTNQFLSEIIGESDYSFIYEKIGENIKNLFIDEFQDTSALQWENLKPILKDVLAENNFGMLVGDVKQSIYRWRNGDWRILNDIENEFGENVNYKKLDKNWRSARNIVQFNNDLFKNISQNFCDDIKKAYNDAEQIPQKNTDGLVSVDFVAHGKSWNTYETEDGENLMINAIAEKVKILLENGDAQSDICILCRNGKQIRMIAEKLPKLLPQVKIISEQAYVFSNSIELKMIICALRIIENPRNLVSAAALLKLQGAKICEITREKCEEEIIAKICELSGFSLKETVEKLYEKFGFYEKAISPFLSAFMDILLDFSAKKKSDINSFLEYWDEKLKDETLPLPANKNDKRDGIMALTIHKSKGLQFHSVIVAFADWAMSEHSSPFKQNLLWCSGKNEPFDIAMIPVEYSQILSKSEFYYDYEIETEAQNMDNLNVLYVALTRAQKNLFVLAKKQDKCIGKLIFDFSETIGETKSE